MFGVGLPVALQEKVMLSPSTMVLLNGPLSITLSSGIKRKTLCHLSQTQLKTHRIKGPHSKI